ncbi:hypothetical protein GCM10010425_68740 [Streptomyces spororaveus]|uniref:Transposase of IS4/5 family DUF4096 n=1 Tax=Streptomyces spororaveus TaxID=284039 RepID=A0ABQ3T312_9ACTN|nr:hypothetical protein Sspor_03340 [Streptomyces spororaveus]
MRLGAFGPRRYAGLMTTRRPYPSDLSDARWELIEPVLAAWRFERRGRVPSRRSDWFRLLGEGGEAELLLLGDAAAGVPEAVAAVRDITVIHLNAAEGPQPR